MCHLLVAAEASYLRQNLVSQIKSRSKVSHARNPIAVRLLTAQSSHCPNSVRRWTGKVNGAPQSRQRDGIRCSGTVSRLHSGQVLCMVRFPHDVHTHIKIAGIVSPFLLKISYLETE